MQLTIQQNSLSLQSAYGVILSPIGATFPETLKQEDWEKIGEALYKLDNATKWIIGDWWIHGNHYYGSRKAWADEQEKKFKGAYTFKTLIDIASICKAFETTRRRGVVSFWKYRELISLSVEKQEEMLDQIENGTLKTFAEIREKAASSKPKHTNHKKRHQSIPTNTQLMLRRSEMLNKPVRDGQRPLSLTRQQVDPDFKGSSMEWMDKYGHVQVMTKDELEADKKQAAVMAWISALNDLRGPLERYLECSSFDPAVFEHWISKSEVRTKKITEAASLIQRTWESMERLLVLLHPRERESTVQVGTAAETMDAQLQQIADQ